MTHCFTVMHAPPVAQASRQLNSSQNLPRGRHVNYDSIMSVLKAGRHQSEVLQVLKVSFQPRLMYSAKLSKFMGK